MIQIGSRSFQKAGHVLHHLFGLFLDRSADHLSAGRIECDLPGCKEHPIHHDALRIGADGRWCIIRAYYFHVFSCFSYAKLPQADSTSKRILSRLPNSFFYLLITYLQ